MKRVYFFPIFAFVLLFFSCAALRDVGPSPAGGVDRRIAAAGTKSAAQLADFFVSRNPAADYSDVLRLAGHYVEEAGFEGINSDVAFVQMCLETGFLRFGGLVTADMHNYCGLGAIDAENPGERFATEQLGVRAHIQHLHAYGTTGPLRGELADRRYKYVQPRGKAPDIFALAGTWAADPSYGEKLDRLIAQLESF